MDYSILVPDFGSDGDDTDHAVDSEVPTATTPTATAAQLVNSLLELTPSANRLYRNPSGDRVRAKSRVIHDKSRVLLAPMRKEVAFKKGKQQASNGEVKAFKPNLFLNCCKRKCASLFPNETPKLKRAREPLFDSSLDRASMRSALLLNADALLPHPVDLKPVCSTTKALLYSCSKSMLFPQPLRYNGRTTGDSNRARAKVALSVCSWFEERKKYSDIMPDTGFYQLTEPTRKFVKEQYDLDVDTVKACPCERSRSEPCDCEGATPIYIECSPSYFNQIWFDQFSDVKTRKWCRFSKCTLCIQMRALRDSQRQNKYALMFLFKSIYQPPLSPPHTHTHTHAHSHSHTTKECC